MCHVAIFGLNLPPWNVWKLLSSSVTQICKCLLGSSMAGSGVSKMSETSPLSSIFSTSSVVFPEPLVANHQPRPGCLPLSMTEPIRLTWPLGRGAVLPALGPPWTPHRPPPTFLSVARLLLSTDH